MSGNRSIRVQGAVVILLFIGSLTTVFVSSFQTLAAPQGEKQAQEQLRDASQRMCLRAEEELAVGLNAEKLNLERINPLLRKVSAEVLSHFPGVEGGFYLGSLDKFAGYGYPTNSPEGPAPPRVTKGTPAPHGPRGDAPPPKEVPFILVQAQHSLGLEPGDYQFDVRSVGPSRVAIVTAPVGSERPARLAVWTMYRLTKPEDLGSQVFRYQLSTGLALGGIALAVVLTANLARTLRHHRIDEERLRQEQEKLREELRRSEHLASLGKLLAGVAHEIRNPLAGIRSTVQLWERLPDTTRTPSSMNAVIQAVDRLNAIVTRLLYFARADGAERESVSINPMILETLELLSAQSSAQGVTLEHPLQDGLPAVLGSANALRQVFLNLATNALQAMPGGGCLRVGTRLLCEKHQVEICFVDTGTGITPEDLPHVFDPFYTTRPEGTGLGLALCQEIVQQHGGKIELTSSVGVGSSFRVLLPAT